MVYKFRLYVTPLTSNSRRAISNLEALCQEELASEYDIEIVGVSRDRLSATVAVWAPAGALS